MSISGKSRSRAKAAEHIERRKFVQESVEIHCAGTDRRLAALKNRYAGNRDVLVRLENFEITSEGTCR